MGKNEQIKDYKNGEILEIESIYNNFYHYVYTITVNMAKAYLQEEDIEEVISDTFLVLWKNRDRLEDDRKIKPYIAGITKKLIQEKCRKRKIYFNILDYENKLQSIDEIDLINEEREEISLLKHMVKQLKEPEQQILELYYYQSMKIKEIAKHVNLSEFTIKQKLYRMRKRMKREIEAKGGKRNEK